MSVHTRLDEASERLVNHFGQAIELTRITLGAYAPATGTQATTEKTYAGYGAVSMYTANEIDNERVLVTDRRIHCRFDIAPIVGDVIAVDSLNYRVVSVTTRVPGGEVVGYEVQARL